MPVVTDNLKSLLEKLDLGISEVDLADIGNFLNDEILGPDPSAKLIEAVEDFVQKRSRKQLP